MSERRAVHCRKEGGCLDQNGRPIDLCPGARESKDLYNQSPLLPAERICLTALGCVVESRAKPLLVDSLASIGYDLDRAIGLPSATWTETDTIDHDFRSAKLNIFLGVAEMLRRTESTRLEAIRGGEYLSSALQLRRLAIFMPAFKTRVDGTPLTYGLINQTHRGLCDYIGYLQTQMHSDSKDFNRKKQIASHLAECEAMGLLSRLGSSDTFPWPAIAREEASHARKQHNHDFYTISNGHKNPYQIKTSANGKGYRSVAIIQQYDIFRAMRRDPTTLRTDWKPPRGHEDYEWPNPYTYEHILTGETPDPLADLLVEEAKLGTRFDKDKKNVLSLASSYVLSRRV